ncbi:hypothetical protein [Flavobacterium sp.]|jgi:hypothetical protein|uniref:hypothetical protein n=2 Tax=Flavobacterium sp. TaxID=239 RepID=UPI003919C464
MKFKSMKKNLLLLLIMLPLIASAKFYKAKIIFNDGNSKNGFIELPEYPDDSKIKFRSEEKGKTEKYDINEVNSFEITNDKNQILNYITLKLAEQGTFNLKKIKPGDKKVWARIVKEGKISIYATYYAYNPGTKTGGGGTFYIKRENEDFALYLDDFNGDELSICMNCFSNLKKTLKAYFEEICPVFLEKLNKEEYNKKGVIYFIELYEQNCGK